MQTVHSSLVNETALVNTLNQVAGEIFCASGTPQWEQLRAYGICEVPSLPAEIFSAENMEMRINIEVHAEEMTAVSLQQRPRGRVMLGGEWWKGVVQPGIT